MGILPFSTMPYGIDSQVEINQSEGRVKAIKKIAEYIDTPYNSKLGFLISKFLGEPVAEVDDSNEAYEYYDEYFRKALVDAVVEQKKAELRTRILCLLNSRIELLFTKTIHFKKCFPNETKKSFEDAVNYAYYVIDAVRFGRSLDDILKLPSNKICEIAKFKNGEESYKVLEDFVFENNIGIQYLRQMVKIINKDENAVCLTTIFEQVKNEAKAKKEDIKTGTALQRRYKLLKKRYRIVDKSNEKLWDQLKELKRLYRKFERRSIKYSKLNTEFENKIKYFKKFLRTKHINFDEFENMYLETKKDDISTTKPTEQNQNILQGNNHESRI